ncbi:MAG: superoxide dismutase [Planctomycetota bacterium]|nr:MAG: superoxide dismutase [Planctomycetota bacterium]
MARRNVWTGITLLGLTACATAVIWTVRVREASAHCQMPCGIYDDPARIAQLREDAATIEKAVAQIRELAGKHDPQSLNQITRWINTKEQHASHIIEVVSEYFLTQKVKPKTPGSSEYESYLKKLADHHAVMVAAMKTKQTVDPEKVHALQHAIDALAKHYTK